MRIHIMPIDCLVGGYETIKKTQQFDTFIISSIHKPVTEFNHFRFTFDDVNMKQPNFMSKDDADKIREIAQNVKQLNSSICVCCDGGLSRSPAVTAAIAHICNEPIIEKSIFRQYQFLNKDIYHYIVDGYK